MIERFALLPVLCLTLAATAQTSTRSTSATHRTPAKADAKTTLPAGNAADNPPGVPPVHTAAKTLYALRYVDITAGTGPLAPPQKFYTVR